MAREFLAETFARTESDGYFRKPAIAVESRDRSPYSADQDVYRKGEIIREIERAIGATVEVGVYLTIPAGRIEQLEAAEPKLPTSGPILRKLVKVEWRERPPEEPGSR
jgi:hypothetical protein